MLPALRPGDIVIVNRQAYDWRVLGMVLFSRAEPAFGDIAIVRLPDGQLAVKRVAAVPGDRFEGVVLGIVRAGQQTGCVSADHYAILGDNGPCSRDSRHFGVIPRSSFRGRVAGLLWRRAARHATGGDAQRPTPAPCGTLGAKGTPTPG